MISPRELAQALQQKYLQLVRGGCARSTCRSCFTLSSRGHGCPVSRTDVTCHIRSHGAQSTLTSPAPALTHNRTEHEAPSSRSHPSNGSTAAPKEVPPCPWGGTATLTPKSFSSKSHQGATALSRGFRPSFSIYMLFKARVRVEGSSFSSTFVAGIDLACWGAPGRKSRTLLGCQEF